MSGDRVPALGGVAHKVRELDDVDSFVRSLSEERRGWDLYPPLLVLALFCLLGETWLANTRWRARARGGAAERGAGAVGAS